MTTQETTFEWGRVLLRRIVHSSSGVQNSVCLWCVWGLLRGVGGGGGVRYVKSRYSIGFVVFAAVLAWSALISVISTVQLISIALLSVPRGLFADYANLIFLFALSTPPPPSDNDRLPSALRGLMRYHATHLWENLFVEVDITLEQKKNKICKCLKWPTCSPYHVKSAHCVPCSN